MNRFKKYYNHIIPLQSTVEAVRQEFLEHFTTQGYRVLDSVSAAGGAGSITIIPPAGEALGNDVGRDVLRVDFTSTKIGFTIGVQATAPRPQEVMVLPNVNSSTTYLPANTSYPGITLNGKVIKFGADNFMGTVQQWAQRAYDVLMADPDVTAIYDLLVLPGDLGGVRMTAKNPAVSAVVGKAHANAVVALRENPAVAANQIVMIPVTRKEITIDLGNGFAHYTAVHGRTIMVGSELVGGYNGPLVASWTDNDAATAGCPSGCSPVELMIGELSGSNYVVGNHGGTNFCFGHGYGLLRDTVVVGTAFNPVGTAVLHPTKMQNVAVATVLAINGSSAAVTIGSLDSVHRLISFNPFGVGSMVTPSLNLYASSLAFSAFVPSYAFQDVTWAMTGAPAQVKLALVGMTEFARTLATAITAADNTLELSSTANLPTTGNVMIGAEVLKYTGILGNTLTGVTRAQEGSVAAPAAVGSTVTPAMWYVRFNEAMLAAGSLKPAPVA